MSELPRDDEAMSDIQLARAAARLKIPYFRGVFMLDDLASLRPLTNECSVVNLDSRAGPGTHWVAYSKRGSRSLYFDSFGDLPPPREISTHLAGTSIRFNYSPEQTYGSVICGHLCLVFLIKATLYWSEASK